ncbi:hypothetical protein AVEN_47911-1 [Araneus ventricosus]|uniref:Retrovirus-related Pol polyprotein from transposon TNT 1-94 n=1 Tax=Araneus ventricosus TaxID=182803 RepID=A0A4Y2USI3_ARAVE|nr:hypothetical protein AVEN_47911-1 [Araneus ventricosus]
MVKFLFPKVCTLKRFRIENSKAPSTLCEVAKSQEGDPAVVYVPYKEAVGCLQYRPVATRQDIAYVVALTSGALCKTTKDDWKHVKRIYRYLQDASNVGSPVQVACTDRIFCLQ